MLIDVKQENIDDALRYKLLRGVVATRCPIALAAKDAGLSNPRVSAFIKGGSLSYIADNGTRESVCLPPAAVRFIEAFDNAETVQPMWFAVRTRGVAA